MEFSRAGAQGGRLSACPVGLALGSGLSSLRSGGGGAAPQLSPSSPPILASSWTTFLPERHGEKLPLVSGWTNCLDLSGRCVFAPRSVITFFMRILFLKNGPCVSRPLPGSIFFFCYFFFSLFPYFRRLSGLCSRGTPRGCSAACSFLLSAASWQVADPAVDGAPGGPACGAEGAGSVGTGATRR